MTQAGGHIIYVPTALLGLLGHSTLMLAASIQLVSQAAPGTFALVRPGRFKRPTRESGSALTLTVAGTGAILAGTVRQEKVSAQKGAKK